MMLMESGRYAQWGDELRIAGNLTSGIPIRIARGQTAGEFQEDLFKLRDYPALSESDFLFTSQWAGIYEGIISNDFPQSEAPVMSVELLEDTGRGGNSMWMRDGRLIIELRHPDTPEEKEWTQRLGESLKLHLAKPSANARSRIPL